MTIGTSPFEWAVDGERILFTIGQDGVHRPFDFPDLRARAWAVEGGWRASISNGKVIKISVRRGLPQDCLRECAQFFRVLANAA